MLKSYYRNLVFGGRRSMLYFVRIMILSISIHTIRRNENIKIAPVNHAERFADKIRAQRV